MQVTPISTGIQFPADQDDPSKRSTTQAGAQIVAAALEPLNADAAQAALRERHWRRHYPAHFKALTALALPSAELALSSAHAGLSSAAETMRWRLDTQECSLADALGVSEQGQHGIPALRTGKIHGRGDPRPAEWGVPLGKDWLRGEAIKRQADRWVQAGVIEQSACNALHRCVDHPDWFDLSDRWLVLQGAGSEAGPLRWLSRWRANLVGIDIPSPGVWQKIAKTVEDGNAILHFPTRSGSVEPELNDAGCDLLTDTPAIATWIKNFGRALDVGSHAYLDGEKHVRVSLAMDWVVQAALSSNPKSTLAYMATPTDVFAVPESAARAAQAAFADRPIVSRALQGSLRLAAGDRFFAPNVPELHGGPDGLRYGLCDSLVIEQGPNYALAKRLQQWRAIVARAAGHRVSLNIAPSTTTASVVKNPALAAGFAGADTFGIEVFSPETTNALMAALWVHDLRSDESAANPAKPLHHPFELFMDQACHGGLWRCAYLPRTALPFAAALGWVKQKAGAR